jgi:large subunit ribosomal protein L7/L12
VVTQEKPKEKTIFNVKLESFDTAAKPKIIREVKALVPNLTLIDVSPISYYMLYFMYPDHFFQAKKFVESLPKILKENLSKQDAEKMKATFEALGAVVKLE